jgi:ketosteroid isomerase-like protein
MSQENVEVVRRSWEVMSEATSPGDDPIARLFEQGIFAQECRFIPPQGIPGGKPFVGQEEISDWYRTWTEEFVDYRWSPEKIIDASDDCVVAVVRQSAKGKESGAAVELRAGFVYTLGRGKIVEVVNYLDPQEALEAVGLRESNKPVGQPRHGSRS